MNTRSFLPTRAVLPVLFTLAVTLGRADAAPPGTGTADKNSRPATDAGRVLFRTHIEPILTSKCLTCHAGDKKKGKLDLSRRESALAGGQSGAALVPGRPADSLLYQKVAAGEMPPQNPLAPEQVDAFRQWIEAGAPYLGGPLAASVQRAGPDWWSLQPVRRPAIPAVSLPAWVRTPVDAFILARLDDKGLRPAPEADRATLIRRATFDLTGLPPTPEEIGAFVKDADPSAYEKLIDRLLASPQYGERWARHWLDVVRFAESHGYEMNTLRPTAWPYRDYVIRALNEDVPYPRFILEQLAGDTIPGADLLTQSATGFLVGGAHDLVDNGTIEGQLQQRMDDLDDLITATAATFLGLTVNCSRCHDHKFDPITQRDYYGMQAVFAGVQHAERTVATADGGQRQREAEQVEAELARLDRLLDEGEPLARTEGGPGRRPPVNARRNVERFTPVAARSVRFTITATNDGSEPCLDELEVFTAGKSPTNIALVGAGAKASASSTFAGSPLHKLAHVNDGRYGNGRSWISREPGKGWVQIDLPGVRTVSRVVWGRDREEKFKDRLATAYHIEVAVEPGRWQVVASSADRLPPTSGATAPSGLSGEQLRQRRVLLER